MVACSKRTVVETALVAVVLHDMVVLADSIVADRLVVAHKAVADP